MKLLGATGHLFMLAGAAAFAPMAAAGSAQNAMVDAPDSASNMDPADRMVVAAQINHIVKRYFAHWEGLPPDYDWDAHFASYLKEALAAPDRRTFSLATMRLIASLDNGHSSFTDQALDDEPVLPFHAMPIEGKWAVTASWTPLLSPGDEIITVDGLPIEEWLEPHRKLVGQSDLQAKNRVLLLQGRALWPDRFRLGLGNGGIIEIERTSPRIERRPALRPREVETIVRSDGVVVVRVPSFDNPKFEADAISAVKTHAGAQLIVFDVRGNGGGSTPSALLRTIMDQQYAGSMVITPMTLAEVDARNSFNSNGNRMPQTMMRYGPAVEMPASDAIVGKMAILLDTGCASACEDFAIRFQSGKRGPLVGERSFGSTGQPFLMRWPQWGMRMRISTKREYLPDGSQFEGVGVPVDIPVPRRRSDLTDEGDPHLERALKMLLN